MTDKELQLRSQGGDLFYESLIKSYLDDARFIERSWLQEWIQAAQEDKECRFLLLTAEPGAGKTAFMAWTARVHPNWPRYFIRRDQVSPLGPPGAHSLLLRVGLQLAAYYPRLFSAKQVEISIRQRLGILAKEASAVGADVDRLIASPFMQLAFQIVQEVGQAEGQLKGLHIGEWVSDPRLIPLDDLQYLALIDPAAALLEKQPEQKIVILVDALDELRYQDAAGNLLQWLANAPPLPGNIRFVLTSRPDELLYVFRQRQRQWLREEDIDPQSEQVQHDLRRYAVSFADRRPVKEALTGQEKNSEVFVNKAVEKAEGNFQYLAALFRAIEEAVEVGEKEQLARLLGIEDIPAKLEELYAFFIRQIRRRLTGVAVEVNGSLPAGLKYLPAWEGLYQPILGILSVAKEPLEMEQVRDFAHIPVQDRWLPGARERLDQFLDREDNRCRLYHTTLPEFLTSQKTKSTHTDCYLAPVEWHGKIVCHIMETCRQNWLECGDYSLNYLVQHMLDAQLTEKLQDIFTDDFLNARMIRAGWHMPFVEDMERVEAKLTPDDMVNLYLKVIYGKAPNSLVMQRVFRQLVRLRPRLKKKRIHRPRGHHPELDQTIDQTIAVLDIKDNEPEKAVAQLAKLFGCVKNRRVQGVITLALGETGCGQAVKALLRILKSAAGSVSWCAADALIALNDRLIIQTLKIWFGQPDRTKNSVEPGVKERILYILGRMQEEQGREMVQEGLAHKYYGVKGRAIDLIWLLHPVEDGEFVLWQKLGFSRKGVEYDRKDPAWKNEWLQKRLVTALGRIGSREVHKHLEGFKNRVDNRNEPKTEKLQRQRRELKKSITRAIRDLEQRHGEPVRSA